MDGNKLEEIHERLTVEGYRFALMHAAVLEGEIVCRCYCSISQNVLVDVLHEAATKISLMAPREPTLQTGMLVRGSESFRLNTLAEDMGRSVNNIPVIFVTFSPEDYAVFGIGDSVVLTYFALKMATTFSIPSDDDGPFPFIMGNPENN